MSDIRLRPLSSPRVTTAALLVALVAATAGAARARTDADPRATAAPNVVTVTAREYAFEAPDSIVAGLTTLRLLDRGSELHHIALFRLDGGHTAGDFYAALKAGGPPPGWVYAVGGPNSPVPGGESVATLDLKPGRYLLTCFIPAKDGVPHIMKGMAHEMIVVAPRRATVTPARFTAPANTITLTDYAFTLAHPITAGTHTVRIANAAEQTHEIFVVRLAPGKSAHEMAEWTEKQDGPPPGMPLGGTTGMAKGEWNDVTMTFEPGDYALLCFWPDVKDGKPHVAHGMMTQFTVR